MARGAAQHTSTQIERRVGCDIGEFSTNTLGRVTLTNILSVDNKARYVMPRNFFIDGHKTIKLRIWGNKSGFGDKTIHFAVLNNKTFDKFQPLHKASLGDSQGGFYLEIVATATDAASQDIQSTHIADSGIATLVRSSAAVRFNTDKIFRIYGEKSNPHDTLTINRYEMFVCG